MTTATAPPTTFTIATPDHLAALAHPLRLAVLRLVADTPMTNQQLAEALGESPARLHFHVKTLHRAGLITLVETRPKGGVLEKFYAATAQRYELAEELLPGESR